jgi:hypothetical protein
MSCQRLSLNILPVLTSEAYQSEIRQEGSGYQPDPVRPCQTVPRVTWVSRPGRYLLPSGFTPVRITKLFTNPFPLFYYYQISNSGIRY